MNIKERFSIVKATWGMTLKILKRNPIILTPFFIVGVVDAILLTLIYLAPRPPLSAVLAPPIRAFWGEKFLHYPTNFALIPTLFRYAHIISSAFLGVLMSALSIGLIQQANEGYSPLFGRNLIKSFKRYFTLLSIWAILFLSVTLVFKGPQILISKYYSDSLRNIFHIEKNIVFQLSYYISFILNIIVETIFIYALPAAIIENKKVFGAVKRAVSVSKSLFLPTLLLVTVPTLFYFPLIIAKVKLPALMIRFSPEIVLVVLGVGVVFTMAVDCLITLSTTMLFILKKDTETD